MICKKIVVQIRYLPVAKFYAYRSVCGIQILGAVVQVYFSFFFLTSPPLLSFLSLLFSHIPFFFPLVSFPFPGNVTRFKMDIRRFLRGKMFDCEITVAKSGLHFRIFFYCIFINIEYRSCS